MQHSFASLLTHDPTRGVRNTRLAPSLSGRAHSRKGRVWRVPEVLLAASADKSTVRSQAVLQSGGGKEGVCPPLHGWHCVERSFETQKGKRRNTGRCCPLLPSSCLVSSCVCSVVLSELLLLPCLACACAAAVRTDALLLNQRRRPLNDDEEHPS